MPNCAAASAVLQRQKEPNTRTTDAYSLISPSILYATLCSGLNTLVNSRNSILQNATVCLVRTCAYFLVIADTVLTREATYWPSFWH